MALARSLKVVAPAIGLLALPHYKISAIRRQEFFFFRNSNPIPRLINLDPTTGDEVPGRVSVLFSAKNAALDEIRFWVAQRFTAAIRLFVCWNS
jgi:hypothetical protein